MPNFIALYVFTLLAGFFLLLACLPYIHKDIWSFCVVDLKTSWGLSSGVSMRECVLRRGWRQHVTWSCFCQQLPSVRCSWCNGLEKAYEFFWHNLCWENELQVRCFMLSLLLPPFKPILFVLRVDACDLWENVRAYNLFWLLSLWIQREQVLPFGIGFGSGVVL